MRPQRPRVFPSLVWPKAKSGLSWIASISAQSPGIGTTPGEGRFELSDHKHCQRHKRSRLWFCILSYLIDCKYSHHVAPLALISIFSIIALRQSPMTHDPSPKHNFPTNENKEDKMLSANWFWKGFKWILSGSDHCPRHFRQFCTTDPEVPADSDYLSLSRYLSFLIFT